MRVVRTDPEGVNSVVRDVHRLEEQSTPTER